jgi:WD40 repeat protein
MAAFAAALTTFLQGQTPAAAASPAVAEAVAVAADPNRPVFSAQLAAEAVTEPAPMAEPGPATQLLEQLAARLETPPPPRRTGLWVVLAAAAVLIAAVAVLVVAVLSRDKAPDGSPPAPAPAATISVNLGGIHYTYDNSVNFFLDGKPISHEELQKQVKLPAGDHQLVVKRGDVEVEVRRFRVAPEDNDRRVLVLPDEPKGPPGEARVFQHSEPVTGVAFSPDGLRLLSCINSGVLTWRLDGPADQTPRSRNIPTATRVAWLSTDRVLVAQNRHGDEPRVCLWDDELVRDIRPFPAEARGWNVWQQSLAPDGRRLALAVHNNAGLVYFWEVEDGKLLGATRAVAVAFVADSHRALLSVGNDLVLWDVDTMKELKRLAGHTEIVYAVAVSPDGRIAASGSTGTANAIRLWDLESGKELHVLPGHTAEIAQVAFSPDGRRLLSASHDKTVRLWDVAGGKELACFREHTEYVTGVAFSPGGRRAASSSGDRTVRIWNLPE